MTVTIDGPNGISIDFPDGTDPATIKQVMDHAIAGAAAPAAPQSNAVFNDTGAPPLTIYRGSAPLPATADNLKGMQKAPDGNYYVKAQDGSSYLKLQKGDTGNMLVPAQGDPFEGKSLNDALSSGAVRFSDLNPDQQAKVADYNGTTLDNVVRGAARGIPFVGPWMEGASARLNALTGGLAGGSQAPNYDQRLKDNLAYEAARDQSADRNNPYSSGAAQVAGGIAGTIAMAPELATGALLKGADAGMTAAPSALNVARNFALGTGGETFGGNVLRATAAGALQGGNAGLAEGGDLGSTAAGAAGGAATGALLGTGIGVLGKGLGAVANRIQDKSALPDVLKSMSPDAVKYAQSITPPENIPALQSKLAALGPEATLADVSPEWRGVAGGVGADVSNRGIVFDPLTARDNAAPQRLATDLSTSIGPGRDPTQLTDELRAQRAYYDSQAYPPVHDNAPPVDVLDTLDLVRNLRKTSVGATDKALSTIEDYLTEPKEVPVMNSDGTQAMSAVNVRASPSAPTYKPQELRDFINGIGGIKGADDELKSMGLNKLIKANGVPLDDARLQAAEAGYLGGDTDHAMGNTYTNDLLDALGSEQPVYSIHDQINQNDGYGSGNRGGWTKQVGSPLTETQMVPVTNSQKLHNIRMEIDKALDGDVPALGNQPGALGAQNASIARVRASLDKNLKTQVPCMAKADAGSAAYANQINAVKQGKGLLTDQPFPESFSPNFAELQRTDPNSADAMRKAVAGQLRRTAGTNVNDATATYNITKKEGDFNRDNIRTVFGPAARPALYCEELR